MAIEVLVRRELRWDCTCDTCKSQLRFAKRDVKWDYGGYSDKSFVRFNCPVCESSVCLETKNVKQVSITKE